MKALVHGKAQRVWGNRKAELENMYMASAKGVLYL